MRKMLMGAVALAALATGPARAANVDLVTNGNFETGDLTGWTLFGQPDDLANDLVDVDDASEHGGTYGAFAGSIDPAGFSQTFGTVTGQKYTVTFWLQAERGSYTTSKPNSFSATFGASTLTSLTNTNPFNYKKYSYQVTATAATTTLTFSFSNKFSYFDLDDVSVVGPAPAAPVPEPGEWAMLLGGLAAAAGAARRRTRG